MKLMLKGCGCFEQGSFRNGLHHPGLDGIEHSVYAKSIENVIRAAELVTGVNQVIEGGYPLMCFSRGAAKPCHNGIRYEALTLDGSDGARWGYLVADTIQHYHFPIEINECPQPKIPML